MAEDFVMEPFSEPPAFWGYTDNITMIIEGWFEYMVTEKILVVLKLVDTQRKD